ncbi:MAG TPA: hypothetical protein VFQ65_27595 [Kofleriaceae bacterium]|nr:hypothetical protein [Kofleriaceae bacterium]
MRRILVLVVVAAACRAKAEAPPCGTVAGQFFRLANEDLGSASVDDQTRRAVADQLPAMRDSLAIACSDGAWSAAVRTCMVAAPNHAAFQACEQQLTNDQRKALDHAADGEPRPK